CLICRGSIPHPMQSLCTLRDHCRQWPRNTRYQADATPYLGRTSTGWIAPAYGWRTHSIPSSARASKVGGTVGPSILAVWALMTISNLVGCWTGRSAGLAPLKNLVDVVSSTPRQVSEIRPVGDEATGCHKFSNSMKRRQLLPGREVRNALSITSGERVFDRNQRIWAQPSRRFECAIEVVRAPHIQGLHVYPRCSTPGVRLFVDECGIRIGRVPKYRHARKPRQKLFQQFGSLRTEVRHHEAHPRDVAARSSQTCNEPAPQRVARSCHNDRNGRGGLLGR